MSLRINTNVAALIAHNNMLQNDSALSSSLERLSSGLRINSAADDSSGMAIADSLNSQALGLGQAVKNANDGIGIIKTADSSLKESISIINTIKTKAIQSAQDGQTTESRKAIQADVSKLLEELNAISKNTSFNGQKLLSGNFADKKFQVGAYSGETVSITIGSTETTKIGHIAATDLSFGGEGKASLDVYSNLQNKTYSLSDINLAYDNSPDHGLGAVADAINKLTDVLGITAKANVKSTTSTAIQTGTTDSSFAINGVNIGAVTTLAGDSDGKLLAAINAKTDQHGVLATLDEEGKITLSSTDGRAISVTEDKNTKAVLGGTDMTTLGTVKLTQTGSGSISVTDRNEVAGLTVSTADNALRVSGMTVATVSFTVTAGSVLASGTAIGSGTVLQGSFTTQGALITAVSGGTIIGAGSVLNSGSQIGSGTTLTGKVKTDAVTTAGTKDSVITAGSFLSSGSFVSGSYFEGDVTAYLSGDGAAAVSYHDGRTYVSGGGTATVKTGGMTLTAGAVIITGSTIGSGTILNTGSKLEGVAAIVNGKATLDAEMVIATSSTGDTTITSGSVLTTGTMILGSNMSGKGTLTGDMTLTAGSQVANQSLLANGSTLGTAAGVGAAGVVAVVDDEYVGAKDLVLGNGTILNSGSILKAGTVLTNDVAEQSGAYFLKGTVLTRDIVTSGVTLTADMTIKSGSMVKSGTLLADGTAAKSEFVDSATSEAKSYRLADIDVTTQEGAQIAMAIADSALKSLDKTKSDLGSVQNQLGSTVKNLTAIKINVMDAESSIRGVDFAEESSTFSKMQVLVQASSFAMAQSNATGKAVLSLLQG